MKRPTLPTRAVQLTALLCAITGLVACSTTEELGPIRTEANVDLTRFAGDWYVIASIPTFIEKQAYNAVETYAVPQGNRIETTFTFAKGSFDGPVKVYRPTGFVRNDGSNAIWGMQFIWPIKAEYRVVYIDPAYEQTIIGRSRRDYLWIMARSPQIAESDYQRHLELLTAQGYDISKIRKVPQQPLTDR